jgi:hypothetical protein
LVALGAAIAWQLGHARSGGFNDLTVYLQEADTLIVVDNAQTILDSTQALASLQRLLASARLILCAERLPRHDTGMACLLIPELNREMAFQVFEHQLTGFTLTRPACSSEQFTSLFADVGGNPGALRAALVAGRRYCPTAIAVELYGRIWEGLSPEARLLWYTLGTEGRHDLGTESRLVIPAKLPALCEELERASVLRVGEGVLSASELAPLAQRFVEYLVAQSDQSVSREWQSPITAVPIRPGLMEHAQSP